VPRVHVLTNKMYADPARLSDVVAIVVDIIFATTGIAIALERGVTDIVPMLDPEAARMHASTLPPGSFVLAGEQDGAPIPGFTAPWPHLLLREDLSGKRLVYSTTNGTVALNAAARASLVLATSLVNAAAVVGYARARHEERDIILICAGSGTSFSLEDFYGAGYLAALFAESGTSFELSDAARAAQLLHNGAPARECVENTYAGRMMAAHGLSADLRFCCQKSIFQSVPVFANGRITRA